MSKLIYNESIKDWIIFNRYTMIRGIVGIAEGGILEYGYFNATDDFRLLEFPGKGTYRVLLKTFNRPIYFNRIKGTYSLTEPNNIMGFGNGGFPYSFEKYYSTRYLEEMFQAKFGVKEDVLYNYIDEMPYTFGFEFETIAGYIPEDDLYRVGLIPLRDGSLYGGLEYSTIVLGGNSGINALREQLKVLKEYTIFDKECSLHIHYGSFKLAPEILLRLNNLFAMSDIDNYVVPYAFETSAYKANGKDYCKKNIPHRSFDSLYGSIVSRNFYGDLYQPHPADTSGDRKWNISSRYKALNLVNAVCYNHAKTAEFRFLRPTYNFDKILIWLFVLGAYIKYAEKTELKAIRNVSLDRIIRSVYSVELANLLTRALVIQKDAKQTQMLVKDMYGMRVDIEDQILTYENLSKGQKYFY